MPDTPESSEPAYRGVIISVVRERWPGAEHLYDVVRHPGAAAVLPVTPTGEVLLVRQFRPAIRQTLVEMPAGLLDVDGEDALSCAARELLEETGYVAAEWRRLGIIHNAIGYSDEGIELWLARGLELHAQKLEPGEFLEVFTLPLAQAQAMVRDGRITDAKTVAGLLQAALQEE